MPFKNKKYISKALQIFKQEGLKLSLDELADRMSVSKTHTTISIPKKNYTLLA